MSRLKLYWPDEEHGAVHDSHGTASRECHSDEMIIPFRLEGQYGTTASSLSVLDTVTRAQMLRNRGMSGFDRSGPLKRWVARQAMGLSL